MNNIDRFYYIKNIGESRIRPGVTAYAIDQTDAFGELPDAYEKACIHAITACHVRHAEILMAMPEHIMFNPNISEQELSSRLSDDYFAYINHIIHPTLEDLPPEIRNINMTGEIHEAIIHACARYINSITRLDIAAGRKNARNDVAYKSREILRRILHERFPSTVWTTMQADPSRKTYVSTILTNMLYETAHYKNINDIPDQVLKECAERTIKREPYKAD